MNLFRSLHQWLSSTYLAIRFSSTLQLCYARVLALSLAVLMTSNAANAALVQFDFNDNTAGTLAGQFGGTGASGSAWLTGAPHVTEVGDLLAPAGTNFNLTQSAGTALSVSNDGAGFSAGQLARPLDTPLVGEVWFSFLAEVPISATRAGIGFAGTSGGTSNPRLIFLNDGMRWLGAGDTGVVGSGFNGGTHLVVGKIQLDDAGSNDTLDVWVNPDVSSGLGAPLISLDNTVGDLFGSDIGNININLYGSDSGAIDFISLSDTASAFMDVTGQAQILQAEWTATGSGNWGTGSNWDLGSPPDGVATIFGSAITGPATVTLDQDRAATNVTFDNSNSYTLTANKFTVSGDINTNQGTHTIASDLELSGGVRTLTSAGGSTLNVTGTTTTTADAAGTIVLDGAGNGSLGAIRDNNDLNEPLDGTDNVNVVKRGAGTWTIGAGTTALEDSHGGSTTVEAGTLKIASNFVGGNDGELRSPTISVNSGATLDTSDFGQYTLQVDQRLEGAGTIDAGSGNLRVSGAATVSPGDNGAGTLTVDGDLVLAGGLGGTQGSLVFELSSSSGGANDQIAVTGNLDSNGFTGTTRVSVIPTGGSLDSSYDLITFGGSYSGDGAADFAIDSSLQTRFTQSISVDADSVNLNITGSNATVVWNGNVNDNWNVNSTQNWTNGGADVFFDLDNATFNDTATGSGTVNVVGAVQPASVTINNATKDYTFSGDGSIAGPGSITKSGTGRATISTANTYTGVTNINGGVLHAANNSALGSTSAGTSVNGGTLDITGSDITGEVVSIQGAGSDGRGAVITDGLDSLGGGTRQITNVIQTGDATIGAYSDEPANSAFEPNDYRWDLEPGGSVSSSSWEGNGHALTKKGRGTVSIQGTGDMNVSAINIEQGIMFWQGSTTATGANVTVGNGTDPHLSLDLQTGSAALNTFYSGTTSGAPPTSHNMNLVLQGGSLEHGTSNGTTFNFSGTFTQNDVTGDDTIDNNIGAGGGNLVIPVPIAGTGDVNFGGDGGVVLQTSPTYTGRTQVSGHLQLSGTTNLNSSASVTVVGAGNLDASGRNDGTYTVANGKTLTAGIDEFENGGGNVTGNLVVELGGTLQINTGAGTPPAGSLAFLQNANTIGAGSHRYIAFEAENFSELVEIDDSITWEVQAATDGSSAPASGGNAIVAVGVASNGSTGDDDQVRYDMVFTEPGDYHWYVRTAAPGGGQTDSFFGPSQDADTANPSVSPNGVISRFGISDELKDAESGTGISTDWDWVRADPNAASQGSFVNFEKVTVTQNDVDNQQVFSIAFEPRQPGAQLDKMVLVASQAFADLTDADLDAVAENATSNVQVPPEFFTFNVNGDLDLFEGSTLELDIRSLTDFDNLAVTGTADLFGDIDINLDGFTPAVNATFTVLTTLGGIDDTGLNVTPGFTHSIVGNDLVLTFIGGSIPGDFDSDGDVDGTDFLVWQRNPGVGSLTDWQNNYGAGNLAASTSAVPEPTSLALLGLASLGLMGRRRGN